MTNLKAVHHVQITIPIGAEDVARKFYVNLLSLEEIEKPQSLKANGGLWLQLGHIQLHIGAEDNDSRDATKAHIAYQVQDLTLVRQRLETEGFKITEGKRIPGMDRFETRDPFGNRVEFLQLH